MKKNIGIIFGGQSDEHDVSLMSASSVLKVIDKDKYNIIKIGICRKGDWFLFEGNDLDIENGEWINNSSPAYFPPNNSVKGLITFKHNKKHIIPLDILFPILHGPNGEDGSIQGLFQLANIPYVSCWTTGSAIAMDKVFTKQILKSNKLPIVDYEVVYSKNLSNIEPIINKIEKNIGLPCFIKPSNLGSSVGVSKAKNIDELISGLKAASKLDRKILVEKYIDGREIECSVLGNHEPKASIPGEIIPSNEFYDYIAKYTDGKSELVIPANISKKTKSKIQDLAVKSFKALDCDIMARVDFFYDDINEKIYINELNTIPGFTKVSMYPKLWESSGLYYSDLIDKLIDLALERSL